MFLGSVKLLKCIENVNEVECTMDFQLRLNGYNK